MDVNFKRVVDESSVVLRGVSDLMTLGQKLLTEVSKNKDAGVNTSKLTVFVEKRDELVTRFKTAMAFQRKRFPKVHRRFVTFFMRERAVRGALAARGQL